MTSHARQETLPCRNTRRRLSCSNHLNADKHVSTLIDTTCVSASALTQRIRQDAVDNSLRRMPLPECWLTTWNQTVRKEKLVQQLLLIPFNDLQDQSHVREFHSSLASFSYAAWSRTPIGLVLNAPVLRRPYLTGGDSSDVMIRWICSVEGSCNDDNEEEWWIIHRPTVLDYFYFSAILQLLHFYHYQPQNLMQ